MRRNIKGLMALSAALSLAACGGGDGGQPGADGSKNTAERATAQSIPVEAPNDDVLVISLQNPTSVTDPTLDRSLIYIKDKNNNPVNLSYTENGAIVNVTKIDQLPKGLAQYAWVKNKTAANNLRIKFKAGEYEMATGWQWGPEVSGHNSYCIVLEKYDTGEVVFVGSKRFVGTTTGANIVLNLTGIDPFDQLWTKQSGRLVRARTPNVGSYYYVDQPWMGAPDANGRPANVGIKPYTEQAADFTTALASPQSEVVLFSTDFVTRHPVSALNSSGQMALTQPMPTPVPNAFPIQPNSRYFLENYAEALDAPREWYFKSTGARAGTLTYKPEAGQTSLQFEVPQASSLMTMAGTASGGNVTDVKFSNLKFRYAKGPQTDGVGAIFQQAAYTTPAAIDVSFAERVEFDHCEVSHVGGSGIRFNRRVANGVLRSSEIYDIGAGGVLVGANPDLGLSGSLEALDIAAGKLTNNILVQGNRIHNIGARNPSGHGIWIGHANTNKIYSNVIKDIVHSGISVGWWGASASSYPNAHSNNIIFDNYVYNIGAGGLSDLGGIYTLGYSPNTKITGNTVRAVNAYDRGGRGIYLDRTVRASRPMPISWSILIPRVSGSTSATATRSNTTRCITAHRPFSCSSGIPATAVLCL
ncbi:MAG: right-handed parallel beta-helix repeat-containing protein [Aquabacterium sp.]